MFAHLQVQDKVGIGSYAKKVGARMRIHAGNNTSRDRAPSPRRRMVAALAFCFALPVANAQVATDGTLGARVNLAGPNFAVIPSLGRVSGQNLFHSFATLTVRSGQTLTFLSDSSIRNVISRVTGGQPSQIDGQIRSAAANVNLFLLNPAGVFFGATSSLNVAASFYASTADYVRFADGSQFSARYFGAAADLLPAVAPEAFVFLDRAANIQLTGAQLRVGDGRTLGLIGGNLSMTNLGSRVSVVSAPGGSVAAVASGGASEVLLNGRFKSGSPSGRLELLGGTVVSVNEGAQNRGSGKLVIRGGDVYIDHSRVLAQTRNGDGGEIDIEATNVLHLDNGEVNAWTTGAGNAGRIRLRAVDIAMQNHARIDASCDIGCTTGLGGDIDATASRTVTLRGSGDTDLTTTYIASNTFGRGNTGAVRVAAPLLTLDGNAAIQSATLAQGHSNGVFIDVGRLRLFNGGQIDTSSRVFPSVPVTPTLLGRGGNVNITATDGIEIDGYRAYRRNADLPGVTYVPSGIFSNAGGAGNAGNIAILAGSLAVTGGGEISSSPSSEATGNGGSVVIDLAGDLRVSGRVVPTAGSLLVSGILANNRGSGSGGSVTIRARDIALSNFATISTQTDSGSGGSGGNLFLQGRDLTIDSGAGISATSQGTGRGGSINIDVSGKLNIIGGGTGETREQDSGITVAAINRGDAGSISIKAGSLAMSNNAFIASDAKDLGLGGTVNVLVRGDAALGSQASIYATSVGTGNAGRVTMQVGGNLSLAGGASIATSARLADGGDISLDIAGALAIVNGGGVSAEVGSGTGSGGNIAINAGALSLQNSAITASAVGGSGGNVSILTANALRVDSGTIAAQVTSGTQDGGNVMLDGSTVIFSDATISANAFSGGGGNVSVTSAGPISVANSRLSAEVATGLGSGGNLDLTGDMLLLRNSTISANAFGGDGGNILIDSKNILSNPASKITASSELGIDGTVIFTSPAADLSGALFSVNSSFLDANAVLAARCVGPNEGARTRLAMRLFDADHRVESGFLFPQASSAVTRTLAMAALIQP